MYETVDRVKEGMPGRAIVTAIGHPISIDQHLCQLVDKLPSYLKDIKDYLNITLPSDF